MSSGFSGLNARWKKQLDEGALGAVIPAGTCQCTLIFRQIGESILIPLKLKSTREAKTFETAKKSRLGARND
jgi:hypothetical protein